MRIVEIACLAPVALALPLRAQVATQPPPAIVTGAEAHADAPADRAALLVTVETRGATAAAVAAENSRLTRTTLDTLRAIGLAREQLGTLGYSVQPQYSTQGKVNGYVARNTVRVDIRKIDDVGRTIDAALAGGANSIESLQFTASNADSARREAYGRATAQARGDAEVLARAAGGTLGPLLELTASGGNGARPDMIVRGLTSAAAAPTPINAGPITITVSVNARWQFLPANR
jgi:uncharacterized protein YggE